MSESQQKRNRELALDNAALLSMINGKQAEIDRLKAELASAIKEVTRLNDDAEAECCRLRKELIAATRCDAIEYQRLLGEQAKTLAELAAAREQVSSAVTLAGKREEELAKLRALCADPRKHGRARCVCTIGAESSLCSECKTERDAWLADIAAAGRGEGL